ncbi:hypothetical protein [Castellaniella sp. GW247-6E4]|uniref:hypothetical protein n=1 Tax=Castellaniella sp. GW247-6E4 TaxID=3140380 RepID=UPI003315A824
MRIPTPARTAGLIALGLGATLLFSPLARAADSAQAQYQTDVQRCHSTPGIDQQACLREAGAALEATRRDALSAPGVQAEDANRTARCNALPADQRQDCLTLMEKPGTVTEGSVSGGGVMRETTITIPAPATPAAAPATPAPVSGGGMGK